MELQISELKGKTFEEKLQMWAKEIVPYCDDIAKTKNRAFYAFQSEPKEKPKVLLLGLNPGGDFWYDKKQEVDTFTKGNSYYNENSEWTISKGFEKTLKVHSDLKDEFKNMMYMNILYFNSKNFGDFQRTFGEHWQEVLDKCTNFTKFLIFNIIKPEKIVCLGVPCFSKLMEKETFSTLNGVVKKTKLNQIPVYGISHPSAYLSDVERAKIGWTLANDWFGVEIPEDIELTTTTKIDAQKVVDIFRNKGFLKDNIYFSGDGTLWFGVEGCGTRFQLCITKNGNGYVGIRNRDNIDDKNPVYVKMLLKTGFRTTKHPWLGVKSFKSYSAENEGNLANKIKKDFETFIENLKT